MILNIKNITMKKSSGRYNYKLYAPTYGAEELKEITEVLRSGILTQGPKVAQFEEMFARYVGSKYAVAVNSCTSALFLSLLWWKKNNPKEKTLLIPSVTFVSVANMAVQAGFNIAFTDEIFVGSYYSLRPSNVIDAAHEITRGCYVPRSLMCFSFYPTKLLGGAEGGVIATDSKLAYEWLKLARNNGIERKDIFDWDYNVIFPGWKMNMTDLQAAILIARINKLDEMNEKRRHLVNFYNNKLPRENVSLHIYPIMVQAKRRNHFIVHMAKLGIKCSVHFKPIHLQPAYRKMHKTLSTAEWWGKREVSLPLHENLDYLDVINIANEVQKYGYLEC